MAPDRVGPEGGLPPLRGLGHLPVRALDDDEAGRVMHGGRVAGRRPSARPRPVAMTWQGRLVAIGSDDGAGSLRPSVVLEDPR